MPRVAIMRFTKDYQEVALAFESMVKDAVITNREEDGRTVIEIEGDFEHFVLEDMETWGGHFKFEIKDNRIRDAGDREARAIVSEGMPGFGEVLFSPTIAFVYRRIGYKIWTSTVVERIDDDGTRVVLSREGNEGEQQYEWQDITRDFGQKVKIR